MIGNDDDLNAWPSDPPYHQEKFNIFEFYHKILWNSQQEQQQNDAKNSGRRVTFSKDPPEIFEYTSEYSRNPTLFFNYQSVFKHRFMEKSEYPIKQVLHAGYYKTQSFSPVPNDSYFPATTFKVDEALSINHELDPPPSYQETHPKQSLKRRLSQQFRNEKPVVFIQKTLRKIKSTPKLISERRHTLHKKSTFS